MSASPGEELIDPKQVREELNLIEQVKAAAGVDDDFLAALLTNQMRLAQIERTQTELLRIDRQRGRADEPGEPAITHPAYPFELSRDVPADTQETDPDTVSVVLPYDGTLRFVDLHWSKNSNGLVGVQFFVGDTPIIPRNPSRGYLSANDYANRYPVNVDVAKDETLRAKFINLDTGDSHLLNVFAHVEEAKPEPQKGGSQSGVQGGNQSTNGGK